MLATRSPGAGIRAGMMQLHLGNLTRADGSAIASLGDSVVQVAVHGPSEAPLHKELMQEAAVEVVFKGAARSKEGEVGASLASSPFQPKTHGQ